MFPYVAMDNEILLSIFFILYIYHCVISIFPIFKIGYQCNINGCMIFPHGYTIHFKILIIAHLDCLYVFLVITVTNIYVLIFIYEFDYVLRLYL